MPLVSIVIPSYKPYRFDKTLESIAAQTFRDFEVVVVYDDDTDIVQHIKIKDLLENSAIPEFQFHSVKRTYPPPNISINHFYQIAGIKAANCGIENSKGEFIAHCDDDDYWYPNKLELQFNFIKENGYNFITSYAYLNNEKGRIYKWDRPVHSTWVWKSSLGIKYRLSCQGKCSADRDFINQIKSLEQQGIVQRGELTVPVAIHYREGERNNRTNLAYQARNK